MQKIYLVAVPHTVFVATSNPLHRNETLVLELGAGVIFQL